MKSRTPIDLSELKVIILDEADVFFTDDKNFATVKFIASHKHLKNRDADNRVQWILFSATYPKGAEAGYEKVQEKISEIVVEAQQIKGKNEKLKLNHIQQYTYRCEPKKKLEFIKEVF